MSLLSSGEWGRQLDRHYDESKEQNDMRIAFIGAAAVAALAMTAPSALAAQHTPGAGALVSADKPLDKQIDKALKDDPSLRHAKIDVSVSHDVVYLNGTVASEAEKERAGRIAKVNGVTRVDNRLIVDPNLGVRGTTGKVEDKVKEAGEKTEHGAEKAWDKTKEGVGKAGDETSDAYILTRVKTRLAGVDVLKGSDINVDCDAKVVTLKGTVPTEAARARAIEIAKRTEGVKNVVDRLTIGPKK
jgi:osmotically-inducible protein OsmY